jgi:hypothetical protein
MARSRISDPLSINRFHLLDVSFDLPLVLLPIYGFRSITLPQLSLTYKQVKEGNYEYPRLTAVERAEVSTVILEQGVSFFNSDFGDWIKKGVQGKVRERNLLLIHFSGINPLAKPPSWMKDVNKLSSLGGKKGADYVMGGTGGLGVWEDGTRIPGRAWFLRRCRPVSYKPGSDFDATSGEISLATLEVGIEEFIEISLGV